MQEAGRLISHPFLLQDDEGTENSLVGPVVD